MKLFHSKALKSLLGLFLVFGLVGVILSGSAFAKAKYSWTFSQPWTRPLSNKGFKLFCEKVNEYSDGQIEIQFFADGLLGSHNEAFHGMQDGSITMGVFSPYVSLIPGGMLNWMPWAIENQEEAKIAYASPDGILYKVVEEAWNEVDGHLLFNVSQGSYGLGNNERPIRTPEDLENLKMRVSSSLGFVKALGNMGEGTGMTMQTVAWGELYNALSRGVVDGCWSMWPSLVEERHYEVLKYYSDLNFCWDNQNVVINKEIWEELPEDLKNAVNKAAKEAEEYLYELQAQAEGDFIKYLSEQKNFTIVRLTAEEREAFREKSNMSAVWEELCSPWLEKHYPGQNMTAKILEELNRIHEEVLARKSN